MSSIDVKDQIRQSWNRSSSAYDGHAGHGIHSKTEEDLWKNEIKKTLNGETVSILDVGCGTGAISLLCAEMGHHVTGIDLSEKMLERAREKAGMKGLSVDFQIRDAEKTEFPESSFDLVINRHLLWTLPNPRAALLEWQRVLKPEGRLVVIDGIWNDRKFGTTLRQNTSKMLTGIYEGKDRIETTYSDEIWSNLPHGGGVPLHVAETYLKEAHFGDIQSWSLQHIIEYQRTQMPWYKRIAYKWNYFLIQGLKGSTAETNENK